MKMNPVMQNSSKNATTKIVITITIMFYNLSVIFIVNHSTFFSQYYGLDELLQTVFILHDKIFNINLIWLLTACSTRLSRIHKNCLRLSCPECKIRLLKSEKL